MTKRFWQNWLTVAGGVFAIFGVVMAVAGGSELFQHVFGPLIDPAFWKGGVPGEARTFQTWAYGAWGGSVAGFGLLIAVIAKSALAPGNQRLRLGTLAAVTLWFLVDTGSCLAFGVWGNAVVLNLPSYVALAVPLLLG